MLSRSKWRILILTDLPVSPLSEADPRSLDQLLSAAPNTLSREEKLTIITVLREQRTKWKIEDMAKVPRGKAAKAPKIAASPDLSLDDLGI